LKIFVAQLSRTAGKEGKKSGTPVTEDPAASIQESKFEIRKSNLGLTVRSTVTQTSPTPEELPLEAFRKRPNV
jgi:hypothetical protein